MSIQRWGIDVTGIGAATFHSGFRLHAGGPFPTSRAIEAQSTAKAANAPGRTSVHPAPPDEGTGRVTRVGGSASLLAVLPESDVPTSDFASVARAYGEASDDTWAP